MRRTAYIPSALVILSLMSACHHKDLEWHESLTSDLELVFDWSNAPDADPASMAAYLFEQGGTSQLRYMFDNKHGGSVRVPVGHYSALCMNSDNTDWAQMRNTDDIEQFEIYTADVTMLESQNISTQGLPRARDAEDERLAASPGMMWGCRADSISVEPFTGRRTITLFPAEAICHYTVDAEDVTNLEYARGATIDATLSGMAEGYLHGSSQGTDNPVTMTFSMSVSPTASTLHGTFLTFGECPVTARRHILTLYLIMSDDTRRSYTFDVTQQVSTAPDPRNVHIIVHGLELPKPINSGGGFTPNVGDWTMENVDLDMNI